MFHDIEDVKEANRRAGQHFFSPDTMRFFSSRVHDTLYAGRFFVTSERHRQRTERLYTVRIAYPDGHIGTYGDFEEYASRNGAHAAAKKAGKEWLEMEAGTRNAG